MKVLFLDIDGVINSQESEDTLIAAGNLAPDNFKDLREQSYLRFCPLLLSRLNKILTKSGAVVVFHSTWRKFFTMEELKGFFKHHGFDPDLFIGHTPMRFSSGDKGWSIAEYLKANKQITNYVIIDDESITSNPSFIQTNPAVGLTDEDVEKALALLEKT